MKEPAVARTALGKVLDECEHLLLQFRGPVCDMSVLPGTDVTSRLHGLLASHGVPPPAQAGAPASPYELLRFILTACPQIAGQAEAEIAAYEVRAAAAARPAVGLRDLLSIPASITIIGNACPAAIDAFLARLYPRQRDRIRLIIARHGADPAFLEPDPIPVLQAAQLLGAPPSACALVASTPADIHSARLAGAPAIGLAREPAAVQRLTAAGADAVADHMGMIAGSVYGAAQRRRFGR
jgi:beta-phosphoglucomutase-like phosphatase (HAD superfamily)